MEKVHEIWRNGPHKMTYVVILICQDCVSYLCRDPLELYPESPSQLLDVMEALCFVADLAGRQDSVCKTPAQSLLLFQSNENNECHNENQSCCEAYMY